MKETTEHGVYITKFEIRKLERGKTYKVEMRAVDKDGQIGEWSKPINYKTVTEIAPYLDYPLPLKTPVAEGVKHTVKCHIRGEPIPKIVWTLNGKQISESNSDYEMVNDKGELILVKPVRGRLNGIYQCQGTNKFGTIKNNPTTLDVECKLTFSYNYSFERF